MPQPIDLPALEAGTGPLTFVFLHYWAGSGREWRLVMDELSADFHCLAPDLRGFGQAPAPALGYAVEDYAADVLAFIAQRGLTNFVLVGHSMGAKTAMFVASEQPAGLRGLVLVGPSPPTIEPMTDADRAASLKAFGRPAAAAATAAKILVKPVPDEVRASVIEDNLRASHPAWDAWMRYGSRENIAARLCLVQGPCLIITGSADPIMSPSVHGLETLPYLPDNTPLEILGGVGHLPPLEAPQEVAQLLREFVGKNGL
ncbi:alpha/beta fold hydrolase [Hymenobacter chitinivorans]|uniref:Pimeloyl-ACP methyl ester carboxylesterase n=1 Tax=Hymenobacter chitinivorans DSM 11115 TaxID=1121954 RepID=A0A2M9B4Z1_9BACT|nr:alpha/beta hydrolase [Hymenobacter chitinivorans]PJJ53022.1 pimeloyl-ACP methyl ester carboxylesterase [Hymenobacter chitinivorans DSM 11115]